MILRKQQQYKASWDGNPLFYMYLAWIWKRPQPHHPTHYIMQCNVAEWIGGGFWQPWAQSWGQTELTKSVSHMILIGHNDL
jgi:hypothetical protein